MMLGINVACCVQRVTLIMHSLHLRVGTDISDLISVDKMSNV